MYEHTNIPFNTLVDCDALCNKTFVPYNTSCSWRGYEEQEDLHKSFEVIELITLSYTLLHLALLCFALLCFSSLRNFLFLLYF